MITTSILADSISPHGHRITTALWTYPRYLHAEVMTHRAFARNAASSRAIPISKFVEAVSTNPATFEQYGIGDSLAVELPDYGIGDSFVGEAVVLARAFYPKDGRLNLVLEATATS